MYCIFLCTISFDLYFSAFYCSFFCSSFSNIIGDNFSTISRTSKLKPANPTQQQMCAPEYMFTHGLILSSSSKQSQWQSTLILNLDDYLLRMTDLLSFVNIYTKIETFNPINKLETVKINIIEVLKNEKMNEFIVSFLNVTNGLLPRVYGLKFIKLNIWLHS